MAVSNSFYGTPSERRDVLMGMKWNVLKKARKNPAIAGFPGFTFFRVLVVW